MAIASDLKGLLEELLAPLGPVSIRRMFGGGGVFLDGLMFGLVSDDVLYLKADALSRQAFEAEGLQPFAYTKAGGQTTVMSYWRAPERLLDEPDEMLAWARDALAAARRAQKPGREKRGRDLPAGRRRAHNATAEGAPAMASPKSKRKPHDMGGDAAGPVDRHEHTPTMTERRIDAMMLLLRAKPRGFWVTDENRRTIESLTPETYRDSSYYEKWCLAMRSLLVEKGVLGEAEIEARLKEVRARHGLPARGRSPAGKAAQGTKAGPAVKAGPAKKGAAAKGRTP